MLSKEAKAGIVKKYGGTEQDTGKAEVQIVIMTTRVKELTEHLKINKKDNHSRRGMRLLLGKRGRLLKFLKKKDIARYRILIADLNIKDKY
ncbi:MAG: 30S ribosomal protein S15 [Candidatus Delongbacteria bacterium]|nr:30S ribosomal protein S15 [Candidatus Delongbacteria bacterium]